MSAVFLSSLVSYVLIFLASTALTVPWLLSLFAFLAILISCLVPSEVTVFLSWYFVRSTKGSRNDPTIA